MNSIGSGIFFPICALPFSALIILFSFFKEHVSSKETKIYGLMIIVNFCGLILELLCTPASLVYNDFSFISNLIYKLYLIYLVVWTSLFTLYIRYISKGNDKYYNFVNKFILVFNLIVALIIFLLPIEKKP